MAWNSLFLCSEAAQVSKPGDAMEGNKITLSVKVTYAATARKL
jgi:hypothetical protein